MNKTELKEFLSSINPAISESTVEMWWTWGQEAEDADSCEKTALPGSYRTAEMFLDEFAKRIRKIRTVYGYRLFPLRIFQPVPMYGS